MFFLYLPLTNLDPQLDERDDAFLAVELWCQSTGWLRTRRHCQEKVMRSYHFPFQEADTDVRGFEDQTFECPVWRAGHIARGSSEIAAGGGGGVAIELIPLLQ
jgi:hypothetical protein